MVFVFLRSKGNRPEQSDMLVQFTVSPSGYWTGIIPFFTLYQAAPSHLATRDEGKEEAGGNHRKLKKQREKPETAAKSLFENAKRGWYLRPVPF
jgi:hypothetical protein